MGLEHGRERNGREALAGWACDLVLREGGCIVSPAVQSASQTCISRRKGGVSPDAAAERTGRAATGDATCLWLGR
jgi:hypothetical protein